MRKYLVVALTTLIFALAFAGSAQAVKCRTLKCINKTLTSLTNTNTQQTAVINQQADVINSMVGLLNCEAITPVTSYGDGYMWDDNGNGTWDFNVTALDFTATGDTVDEWMVVDACETATVASRNGGTSAGGGAFPRVQPPGSSEPPAHSRSH
jgi:hypothetical protein